MPAGMHTRELSVCVMPRLKLLHRVQLVCHQLSWDRVADWVCSERTEAHVKPMSYLIASVTGTPYSTRCNPRQTLQYPVPAGPVPQTAEWSQTWIRMASTSALLAVRGWQLMHVWSVVQCHCPAEERSATSRLPALRTRAPSGHVSLIPS